MENNKTQYFRISPCAMVESDCHEGHTSELWYPTTDEDMCEDYKERSGLSCCYSIDALVSYFACSDGGSGPRGAHLDGAYLVCVEGELSGDDAYEECHGEVLVHPTRIVSCEDIEDRFMELLIDRVGATGYDMDREEYIY